MKHNLQELFKSAAYRPDGQLSDNICYFVTHKSKSITRRNISIYLGVCMLSFFGSIFFIKDFITESNNLGFSSYLSLMFSDSGVFSSYLHDYVLALIDSLPITSLASSMFLLFLLFVSLRKVSIHLRNKLSLA